MVMGKEGKEDGNFGELAKRLVKSFAGFSFEDFFPHSGWLDVLTEHVGRLKAIFNEMDALLDSVIEERINSPENNMLD
ncbi:hypothetical protein V6N11_015270 [Hibiscus sabdariffa]|uniref:Uncharacterized protein n=1 Tax=Hibiscus sabdariffa TaxID=183260 RepID=A0ABR2TRL0_9ROSI